MQLCSLSVPHLGEPDALQLRPRLSDFIASHAEEILVARDEFAATVSHGGKALDASDDAA